MLVLGLVALFCVGIVASAAASPASGGHLPSFSLMNKRVATRKLPFGMRFSFEAKHGFGLKHPIHGPVWFGEVERQGTTIVAAGVRRWVCEAEEPNSETGGGTGTCASLRAARELRMLSVQSSCGAHSRHFRITGLVPDGATGLEIEKEDGTMGRIVPVVENTVSFTVGREDITLHGVGDAAAESLEQQFPLGRLRGSSACVVFYGSAEAR